MTEGRLDVTESAGFDTHITLQCFECLSNGLQFTRVTAGVGTRDFTLIWISIQIKCSPCSTVDVYMSLAVPPASSNTVTGH